MKKISTPDKKFFSPRLLLSAALFLFLSLGTPFLASAQDAPIKNVQGIVDLAKKIANWVEIIFWIAAVIAIFYAAFLFLTGGGDTEKVEKAKKQLLYALIAIVVGLMAYGFQPLVDSFLRGQGGSSAPTGSPPPSGSGSGSYDPYGIF